MMPDSTGDDAIFEGWDARYAAWLSGSLEALRKDDLDPLKHFPMIHPQRVPFAPWPGTPRSAARIGLISSGGFYLKGRQVPFRIDDPEGDPSFRELPADVTPSEVAIAHAHYDHAAALADWNVVFPVDRLRELVSEGKLGSLGPLWSFSGFCLNFHRLYRETARAIAARARSAGCDGVLMVPV